MPGREPERRNRYYSPKVTWLLVILVGIAIIVVGLTMISEDNYISRQSTPVSDSLETSKPESLSTTPQASSPPPLEEKEDLTDWQSFDKAISEVNGTDRFVMLFFRSPDCSPCDSMQYLIFDQPEIQDEFKFKFLPVKISSASDQIITYQGRQISESGMADLFNIPGYPSLLFYDGRTEKFILTYPGYADALRLTRIFEYLKRRMFETGEMSLQEYLSQEPYQSK
jgi:thioredoxin-related protein